MVQWFKQPIFDSRDYDSSRFRAGQSSDSQVSRPSQEDYGILSWRWDSWICWWIVIFPVVNPVNPREMRYRYLSVSGKILKIFAAPFYRNPKDYGAPEVRDPKGCSSGGSAPSFRFGHLRGEQIQPHQRRSWHGGEAWCESHLSLRIQGDTMWYGYPTLVMKHGQPPQRSMIVQ